MHFFGSFKEKYFRTSYIINFIIQNWTIIFTMFIAFHEFRKQIFIIAIFFYKQNCYIFLIFFFLYISYRFYRQIFYILYSQQQKIRHLYMIKFYLGKYENKIAIIFSCSNIYYNILHDLRKNLLQKLIKNQNFNKMERGYILKILFK